MTTIAYGHLAVRRDVLADAEGLELAVIYGSWAKRLHGQRGVFPRDIDLLAVGKLPARAFHDVGEVASSRPHLPVNPKQVSSGTWATGTDHC
ncbi:MAG: hypothetical protein LBG11_09685 [Bifidobacteriaceae bacterium]|jgi:hypothetical protein|nr:hypothetical protein [Bifidobacteriaceae bacterium]